MSFENPSPPQGFSIGICASDSAERLPDLLSFILGQRFGPDFHLQKIVVVASGCPETVLSEARKVSGSDRRFNLISEPARRGKAEAINQIVEESIGKYLVMLNADAFPGPRSIQTLLAIGSSSPMVGCVSARPVFDGGGGILQRALGLMWSAHNLMSLRLNHAGVSNHACDELILVKKSLLPRLPQDLVNDGAYIGGLMRARGFLVRFSNSATVKIEVPAKITDFLGQRRRILFGHLQVWKKLGHAPKTVESMLFMSPLTSLRTLVRLFSDRPRLIFALPVVVAGELISAFSAALDAGRSSRRHAIWKRSTG
jgi:cellulose synthase/poly-beta-1,6-N-acetylglucosamine synthase-like glycosyltransferase